VLFMTSANIGSGKIPVKIFLDRIIRIYMLIL